MAPSQKKKSGFSNAFYFTMNFDSLSGTAQFDVMLRYIQLSMYTIQFVIKYKYVYNTSSYTICQLSVDPITTDLKL